MSTDFRWIEYEETNPPGGDDFALQTGLGENHPSGSRLGLLWRIPIHEGMLYIDLWGASFPETKIITGGGVEYTAKEFLAKIDTMPMRYGTDI